MRRLITMIIVGVVAVTPGLAATAGSATAATHTVPVGGKTKAAVVLAAAKGEKIQTPTPAQVRACFRVNRFGTWAVSLFSGGIHESQPGQLCDIHYAKLYQGQAQSWQPVTGLAHLQGGRWVYRLSFDEITPAYGERHGVPVRVLKALARGRGLIIPVPSVPTTESDYGYDLVSQPAQIIYTGDGTGILAGSRLHQGEDLHYGSLHWASWTAKYAVGYGDDWIDYCNPDCASGRHYPYRVKVVGSDPTHVHGKWVFSRLAVTYLANRPEFNGQLFPRKYQLVVRFRKPFFYYNETHS